MIHKILIVLHFGSFVSVTLHISESLKSCKNALSLKCLKSLYLISSGLVRQLSVAVFLSHTQDNDRIMKYTAH